MGRGGFPAPIRPLPARRSLASVTFACPLPEFGAVRRVLELVRLVFGAALGWAHGALDEIEAAIAEAEREARAAFLDAARQALAHGCVAGGGARPRPSGGALAAPARPGRARTRSPHLAIPVAPARSLRGARAGAVRPVGDPACSHPRLRALLKRARRAARLARRADAVERAIAASCGRVRRRVLSLAVRLKPKPRALVRLVPLRAGPVLRLCPAPEGRAPPVCPGPGPRIRRLE